MTTGPSIDADGQVKLRTRSIYIFPVLLLVTVCLTARNPQQTKEEEWIKSSIVGKKVMAAAKFVSVDDSTKTVEIETLQGKSFKWEVPDEVFDKVRGLHKDEKIRMTFIPQTTTGAPKVLAIEAYSGPTCQCSSTTLPVTCTGGCVGSCQPGYTCRLTSPPGQTTFFCACVQ
jgi:hypothetical protein